MLMGESIVRNFIGCTLISNTIFFFKTAYMSSPCHIEMILSEREEIIPKAEEETKKKVSKKKLKREKMRAAMTGGD